MQYINQRRLLTGLKPDIAASLRDADDDLYWSEVSPFGDGIAHGISIRPDMMEQDYWYPKDEHKKLYGQGRALSSIVNGFVASIASVAGQAGGTSKNTILKPQADYSNVYKTAYASQTNSSNIRFSQNSIKSTFSDGTSLNSTINGLKNGSLKPSDIPPIRIFEKNGSLYSR